MINFDRRIFSTICRTFARYRDPSDFDRIFNSTLRVASTFREHSNSLVLQGRLVTGTYVSFIRLASGNRSNRQQEAFNFLRVVSRFLEIDTWPPTNRRLSPEVWQTLHPVSREHFRTSRRFQKISLDSRKFQDSSRKRFPALAFNERFTALTGRSTIRAGWEIYTEVGKSSTFLMTSALDLRSPLYFSLCPYACSLNHDHPIIWTFFTFLEKTKGTSEFYDAVLHPLRTKQWKTW